MKGLNFRRKVKPITRAPAPDEVPNSDPKTPSPGQLPELPVEIWLFIAEFLAPKDKKKLLGVNRLFYELGMDELYQRLSLVSEDSWLFIDTMDTLSNPDVAHRVRSVTIWPAATWKAISTPNPGWSRWLPAPVTPPESHAAEEVPSWWGRKSHRTLTVPMSPPTSPVAPSVAARMALFSKAILNLTRVEELNIYINGRAEKKIDLSNCLTYCLHKLWAPLKDTVRTVTIDIPSCILGAVLPAKLDIPTGVQRVELMLRHSTNVIADPDSEQPPAALSRFLEDLGQVESLKAFKIFPAFNAPHNLNLWRSLRPMEMITSLTIDNIGSALVEDVERTDLHQWIMQHQCLQELSLSFNVCGSTTRPSLSPSTLPSIDTLPNLTSLTLQLDQPFSTRYNAYLRWVASISPNLSHLHLKNVKETAHLEAILLYFAFQTNMSGVRALPKLERLEASLETLTPALFETLVTRCPNLVRLKLDVQKVATTERLGLPNRLRDGKEQEVQVVKMIHQNGSSGMSAVDYKNWKLEDVSILQWVYGEGRKYNWEVMCALARVVPSIQSFVGRGHMEQKGLKELEPKFELVGFGKRSEAWS